MPPAGSPYHCNRANRQRNHHRRDEPEDENVDGRGNPSAPEQGAQPIHANGDAELEDAEEPLHILRQPSELVYCAHLADNLCSVEVAGGRCMKGAAGVGNEGKATPGRNPTLF